MFSKSLLVFGALGMSATAFLAGRVSKQSENRVPRQGTVSSDVVEGTTHDVAMSPRVDLGVVERGGKVTHAIWFHNREPSVQTIANIQTSCPCLRAEISPQTIEPNGRGR